MRLELIIYVDDIYSSTVRPRDNIVVLRRCSDILYNNNYYNFFNNNARGLSMHAAWVYYNMRICARAKISAFNSFPFTTRQMLQYAYNIILLCLCILFIYGGVGYCIYRDDISSRDFRR